MMDLMKRAYSSSSSESFWWGRRLLRLLLGLCTGGAATLEVDAVIAAFAPDDVAAFGFGFNLFLVVDGSGPTWELLNEL